MIFFLFYLFSYCILITILSQLCIVMNHMVDISKDIKIVVLLYCYSLMLLLMNRMKYLLQFTYLNRYE